MKPTEHSVSRLALLGFAAAAATAGCALTENSAERALVTDTAGEIHAVTTRADRRIAFVDRNWMWGEDRERENAAYRLAHASIEAAPRMAPVDEYVPHHYCAEPSPDVSMDMLSELVARLGAVAADLEIESRKEAAVPGEPAGTPPAGNGINSDSTGLGGGGGYAEFRRDLDQLSHQLFARSQGVQLFRDGLFALCQAHHNGAVGFADYGSFIEALINRSSYLIALELAMQPLGSNSRLAQEDMANLMKIVQSAVSGLKSAPAAAGSGRKERIATRDEPESWVGDM
jgi:hypothetical protein